MTKRVLRVNQLIKREISQIIFREIEFSRDILVTVTRVETSVNLMESRIWISVIPEERKKRILEILNKNIYFLQQKLNKRLKMKPLPRIKFLEERKTKEAGKIEEVLKELEKKQK